MLEKKYCGVLFQDVNPPVMESQVLEFEKAHCVKLPEDYVEFLCRVNGGSPIPSAYREACLDDLEELDLLPESAIPDQIQSDLLRYTIAPSRIDCFLGLNPNTTDSLEALTAGTNYTTRSDASSLLLIAFDKVGTPIYMSLASDKRGWIYDFDEEIEFDAEYSDEPTPLSEMEHLLLAKSFREFIQSLFPARVLFARNFQPTAQHLAAIKQAGYEDP
ncbi:SMI1 / KNR4 family protein [Gimesia maris]|uniref:SMI1/KNR4 family protein n=1 Tax=Gimesia maris TaxID=122 RepID=UPI00118CB417|nr:SMI1/KNR4 family protein [Gimesia maris]QDU15262.1 SMI1 / KNR4 family protein [Gimesia maris]